MKKNQILTLNNLVFNTAQKQDMSTYLKIMKYSAYLKDCFEEYKEEVDVISRKFKTEKKTFKNQQGQEIEYFDIPLSKKDEANDEAKKIGEKEFKNSPKTDKAISGKGIFNKIISEIDVKEITALNEEKKPMYSYEEQLIIAEIKDAKQ